MNNNAGASASASFGDNAACQDGGIEFGNCSADSNGWNGGGSRSGGGGIPPDDGAAVDDDGFVTIQGG